MSGSNPVGIWAVPISTGGGVQGPSTYKGNIDSCHMVAQRVADAFACRPASTPNMTVLVDPGFVERVDPTGQQVFSEVNQQTLTIAAAPSSPNSRIDLIVIDAGTGAASVIAGTAANPGVAPALPIGKRQVAQVSVPNGTSALGTFNITDLRGVWGPFSQGIPSAIATGTADAITAAFTPVTPNPTPDRFMIAVRFIAANATTTPTLNVDTRGNFTITKNGGQALVASDIAANLYEGLFRWNAAGSNWEMLNPSNPVPSGFTTGDRKETYKTTADVGWVMMNDGTIGDASSGGTTRANADTVNLFTLLWNNVSNANCPVSGGRGGSAAADFAAHKTINLPLVLGRASASAGAGSGLTSRALADIVGAETVTLSASTQASMSVSGGSLSPGVITTTQSGAAVGVTGAFVSVSFAPACCCGGSPPVHPVYEPGSVSFSGATASGGGAPHNNIQPTSFVNFMIKL
jgi:microcystin-dependent protein